MERDPVQQGGADEPRQECDCVTGPAFDFAGRAALVSGCGSADGIGFACARIEARAEELRREGATVFAYAADLADREQVAALVGAAQEAVGPLDVLVNAAGMAQSGVPPVDASFLDLSPDDLQRELEITFKTAFHLTQLVLPAMVALGYGRIVMISSVTGPLVTAPGSAAYASAKGALDGLMRTIALEHGRDGITVNSVAPGWIATASSTSEEREAGRHTPVGRAGTAEEVASLVAYLASEEASYVTGQAVVVDGGNTIQEPHGIELYRRNQG